MADIENMTKLAKEASWALQSSTSEEKRQALLVVKDVLAKNKEAIFAENDKDLKLADEAVKAGKMSASLHKRLSIRGKDDAKFADLLQGLEDVSNLEDPIGKCTLARELNEGLELYRVSCPVGVICIIFEARPEVVVQIASLCLLSGNAVILKGGKEAFNSNKILVEIFKEGLAQTKIPKEMLQLVSTREEIASLLDMDKYIDLVIPRGSKSLVTYVQNNTRIPVLGHSDGICSVYLHDDAVSKTAVDVVVDSKTNYTAACNTTETLLVHKDLLSTVLKDVAKALHEANVEIRADEQSFAHISDYAKKADEVDFDTEFLDLIIAIKTVDSEREAIAHINEHGSHHTDCIVSEDVKVVEKFMTLVDSAGVYHNASTRFADGFRYGFGAEIGVSTNKTHARGPVGLEGLLIYKYRLYGKGQTVSQTQGFSHRNLDCDSYKPRA